MLSSAVVLLFGSRLVFGLNRFNIPAMPMTRAKALSRPEALVQRMGPFRRMSRFETYVMRPEQIHPLIRIAHRQNGLTISDRIILDHELVLIVKGRGQWQINGEQYAFVTNDLLLVPPFTPHSFQADETHDCEHVAIHFDLAEENPSSESMLADRVPYRVRFTHSLRIALQRSLFSGHRWTRDVVRVVADHNSGKVVDSARASVRLAGLLLEMLTEKDEERPGSAGVSWRNQIRVETVVAHMRANLAEEMDHRVFERVSELSTSRLQALFREVTGYPPLDFLRRLRVDEARRLLADQRLSVKEIAALTGFRDTSHLSKVFRRVDGLSPAHYRDALLAGQQEK